MSSLREIAVYLVPALVGLGPVFRGLFFDPERMVVPTFVGVATIGWLSARRDDPQGAATPRTALDWWALALLAWYAVAFVTAVHPRGHLGAVLDLASGFAVYLVARRETNTAREARHLLLFTGTVVMLLGLGSMAGWIAPTRFTPDMASFGRLSTTFQYPNAYAAWVLAVSILALAQAAGPGWAGRAGAACAGLFAAGFVLTASRGTLFALPPALGLFLLLSWRTAGRQLATLTVAAWGLGLAAGTFALTLFESQHPALAIAVVVLAAAGGVAARELLWSLPNRAFLYLLLGAVGALLLAGTVFSIVGEPGGLPGRLGEVSLIDRNAQLRLHYFKDAMKIVADHPVSGVGGDGWSRYYLAYQTFSYATTQTHSYWFQVAVESGFVGVGIYLGLWVSFVYVLYSAWRRQRSTVELAGWSGAAVALAAHALVDFDLSFLSIYLLLWLSLGYAAGHAGGPVKSGPDTRRTRYVALGLATALTLAGLALTGAHILLNVGDAALVVRRNLPAAAAAYRWAARLDPLSAEPYLGLARIASAQPALVGRPATAVIADAVARDPRQMPIRLDQLVYQVQAGQWSEVTRTANLLLALSPHHTQVVQAATNHLFEATLAALRQNDVPRSAACSRRIVAVDQQIRRLLKQEEPYRHLWPDPLGYSPLLHLRIGQAYTLAGEYQLGQDYLLQAAGDRERAEEAINWLYSTHRLAGNAEAAAVLQRRYSVSIAAWERHPDFAVVERHGRSIASAAGGSGRCD